MSYQKVQVKTKPRKHKGKNSNHWFDYAWKHMQTIYIQGILSHSEKSENIPLLISDLVAFFETPRTE